MISLFKCCTVNRSKLNSIAQPKIIKADNCVPFPRYVIGLDSVDDESKPENPLFDKEVATPDQWRDDENPPYAYYIYYMYANMTQLNHFRRERCGHRIAI